MTVPLSTNLITTITFHPEESSTPLTILNIYNPPNTDNALALLDDWLSVLLALLAQMIVAGDFNKHHPLWSGVECPQWCRGSGADRLTHIISQFGLMLASPCGVPTYRSDAHGTWSTLDLVLCTTDIEDCILECCMAHADRLPGADHLPVHTVLETSPWRSAPVERCSFEKVDWPAFVRTLTQHLQDAGVSADVHIEMAEELDNFVGLMTQAIQAAIERHAPKRRPSPFAKRWWMAELLKLRHKYAKCSRVEFTARGTESWPHTKQECAAACNAYNSMLRRAKATHWKDWLEGITEQDIWKAARFAQNPLSNGSRTCIPTLYTKSASNKTVATHETPRQKAAVLKETFFPPKLHHLPPYPGDSDPPPSPLPISTLPLSTVHRCIKRLHPFKAPGPDSIPNIVLKCASEVLAPLLHTCLRATLLLRYYPKAWRTWTTIVLRKPGMADYTVAKAYRPVALYNTMGKTVSAVMTDVLVYLTVRHNLLLAKCFGGLPGHTMTESLLYLVNNIKNVWR